MMNDGSFAYRHILPRTYANRINSIACSFEFLIPVVRQYRAAVLMALFNWRRAQNL